MNLLAASSLVVGVVMATTTGAVDEGSLRMTDPILADLTHYFPDCWVTEQGVFVSRFFSAIYLQAAHWNVSFVSLSHMYIF